MTLQLRFICMNPPHPLTPPSFTPFVFTNSYNRLSKQLSIGSKSFSDRWDLHFWASTKRFHIPYGCSVCEGRRNLFEMNFEGWSASFDWSTCSERAHWGQIRTGRIVLLSAWRWRVFQRNCRALGKAFDEAFDEAFNCYERAQPSTGTRVLGAGLGPIGPSAPLPSIHIAFAPR